MRMLRTTVVGLVISGMAFAADEKAPRPVNTPPEGFTALFNGRDLTGWRGQAPDQNPYEIARWSSEEKAARQKAADEDIRRHWRVEDGQIINDGGGAYLTTAKDYGDFELFADWRLTPGTDSGIYLRGTPQVQIWDPDNESVRHLGADKGSGALWNNGETMPGKWPAVKADRPVGQWNTFRILMIGERVSVWLNGRQVVDDAVMANYWDRKKPMLPSGPIQLQTHGGEMRFRNIFLREIPPEEANKRLQARKDEGYKVLFNGKDLDGWIGDTGAYAVRDGVMVFTGKSGDIFTRDTYSNFAIRFEFKLPPGGNNGLLIRVPKPEAGGTFSGMEIQILDDADPRYAAIKPWQHHGSVYGIAPSHPGYLRPTGQWNFQEVVVDGSRIRVFLNGTLITDADLEKIGKPLDDREHPGMKRADGHVGFMGHGDPVEFRNIRLKVLK